MSWIRDGLIFVLVLSFLFFFALGNRPLSSPDEARYSEIPREMWVNHDLITPRLNGIKYFEKPPLLYWIQVFSFKIGGLNEWAARAPTALFALLGCLLCYGLGRFLYGRQTGIYAGAILATSLLYFSMGHVLTLDMTLTFMLSACMSCLLIALNLPYEHQARWFFCYGFYVFAACAVLTKGLVGILFPAAILFFWLLILNRWSCLKHLCLPSGLLLFSLVVAPWHYWVQIKHPEFFNFYILDQQFLRFFTLSAGRYQPAWFFIGILLAGFFPWTIFLVQSLYCACKAVFQDKLKYQNKLFLLLWGAIIFLFFSFSKSKLIPYILPVFIPFSILIARAFPFCKKQTAAWLLIFTTVILFIALCVASQHYLFPNEIARYLQFFAVILVLGGALNIYFLFKQSNNCFWGLTLWAVVFNITLLLASLSIETTSIKPLIDKLKMYAHPSDIIVSYDHYYQDIPFYLNRLITIVNWENELTLGMQHQDTTGLVMSESMMWEKWGQKPPMFIVMDERNYAKLSRAHPLFFIAKTGNDVLVTNHSR